MSRREIPIPAGPAGTLATLEVMHELAAAPNAEIRNVGAGLHPRAIEGVLRRLWLFVPDGPHETMRTTARMMTDFFDSHYFQGDCDDAAVLAAALLLAAPRPGLRAWFAAVRPPAAVNFAHVFIAVEEDGAGRYRIDPTAPLDAHYDNWEFLMRRFL